MKRFTISIPKKLKDELDAMPHVNWPEIAKQGVMNKIKQLETFENMQKQGRL